MCRAKGSKAVEPNPRMQPRMRVATSGWLGRDRRLGRARARGARDWSRTSTALRPLDSESSASTNSATRATGGAYAVRGPEARSSSGTVKPHGSRRGRGRPAAAGPRQTPTRRPARAFPSAEGRHRRPGCVAGTLRSGTSASFAQRDSSRAGPGSAIPTRSTCGAPGASARAANRANRERLPASARRRSGRGPT